MVQERFVSSDEVQTLLDRASGVKERGGDSRTKAIMRDLLEAAMKVIVRHDVSEDEFWGAAKYVAGASQEVGLILPGVGLEHFHGPFP